MYQLLSNKTIIVMGVANERSIAWGIAKSLYASGANLIFTYRQERSYTKIMKLLASSGMENCFVVPCDVSSDESILNCFSLIEEKVGIVHGLVHSLAHANKEDLEGEFVSTSRKGFSFAHDTSAYSLVAVSNAARPLMKEGGSILTITYLGGERVVKNYNVMGIAKASLDACVRYLANDLGKDGIRVNNISAGPIRTLAAKGISGFNDILHEIEEKSPLRRTVDQTEVGDTALFLLSHLSRGITGELIHVDAGYNILGF